MRALLARKDDTTRIAVVGASNDRSKYGNIITRNLLGHGYTVWPVNPGEAQVHGVRCYARVASLPGVPDIVCVVTPPEVTIGILAECAAAGVRHVWLQDGSFDDACLRAAAALPFSTESEACIMVIAARA